MRKVVHKISQRSVVRKWFKYVYGKLLENPRNSTYNIKFLLGVNSQEVNIRQTLIPRPSNRAKLHRISSFRRNHSQPVSKYSLARRTISCHCMSMQFNEHRPSWSFKLRWLNQDITITPQLTEHANIFLNTYPVVVFSHLSLQPFLPCTRSQ